MIFALINTMNKIPGDDLGTVISQHRTSEAAYWAAVKLQLLAAYANSPEDYIPTIIICVLSRRHRLGENVRAQDAIFRWL